MFKSSRVKQVNGEMRFYVFLFVALGLLYNWIDVQAEESCTPVRPAAPEGVGLDTPCNWSKWV